MIPKECIIGDTCFTSLVTIGGNLYIRHAKNINHVHNESKDLLSVIIILVNNVNGDETVFNDGENMNDIRKTGHVLKHSHGRCIISAFDKILHEDSIWTGHRNVLSFILHKSIFLHFVHNSARFYEKYISSKNKKNILMMTGVKFSPKKTLERSTIQNINLFIQNHNML